jgi:hypothetical protein
MPPTPHEIEYQMFGKPEESRRKSYQEAVISREVDTFPEQTGSFLQKQWLKKK